MNAQIARFESFTALGEYRQPGSGRKSFTRERLRVCFYTGLMICDAAAALAAMLVAVALRQPAHAANEVGFAQAFICIYLGLAAYGRVYSVASLANWKVAALRSCTVAILAFMMSLGALFYLQVSEMLSRQAVTVACLGFCASIVVTRRVAAMLVRAVLGDALISQAIIVDAVAPPADVGRQDVVIDARASGLQPKTDDPLMLDRLGRTVARFDRILVACPAEHRIAWARALKGSRIQAEIVIPEFGDLGPLGAGYYAGESTVVVAGGMLTLRDRVLKRALDIAVALPAFVFLSPLLVLVALLVKIDSPGPALFVQKRFGRGNKLFSIFKFRTLHQQPAEPGPAPPVGPNDARVTRIGRFLRRTSIDELPQLLNVLIGTMSLVGPRPHATGATAGDALYWEVDERYFNRHTVKPGMTGLAQARGLRGGTETSADLVNRLQADLEYLRGWTIWRDVAILVRTTRVLIHAKAY